MIDSIVNIAKEKLVTTFTSAKMSFIMLSFYNSDFCKVLEGWLLILKVH